MKYELETVDLRSWSGGDWWGIVKRYGRGLGLTHRPDEFQSAWWGIPSIGTDGNNICAVGFDARIWVSFSEPVASSRRHERWGGEEVRTLVWSNGGGTQSAAITGLIVEGKLKKPDFIAIADTGREDRRVWEYLYQIIVPALRDVGLEVRRIKKDEFDVEDIWQERKDADLPRVLMPMFVDTKNQGGGKLTTVCSMEWKQRIIRAWLRSQGVKECFVWLGMSTDEVHRLKPSGLNWYEHHWPLCFDVPMRKGECIRYVTEVLHWPEPPGSACWMCPNHTDGKWRNLKEQTPDQFKQACDLEDKIRERRPDFYFHRSLKPLREVVFETTQIGWIDNGSCESGMCFT